MSLFEPAARAAAADRPVLLVEADEGDAVLVRSCLNDAGVPDFAVVWTRTLADALGTLDRVRPRCILLDLGLPDADGFGSVATMVDAAPDVPVIVLTGRQERDGLEALGAGAQDYLAKDLLTGELLERSVRYAIERKRAQRAQQQLREMRLSSAEKARLERGLLPKPLLRSAAVECATYYRPGRDHAVLGGDFYDVVETVDGRVRAVIGDVMGHGPDEAALGVHLRVAWRTLLLAGAPDDEILPTLATLLEAERGEQGRFVTVCDVSVNPDGRATVRLAGHPAPVLCADGAAKYLDLEVGPPLGVELPERRQQAWSPSALYIPPGSSLILFTDGLLDAHSIETNDNLGVVELVNAVEACRGAGGPPASWISALVGAAPKESVDDIAVVVLSTKPA